MRRFLWYILKEDGRSGKVVNNVVTFTGQPTPLPETPDGWQEAAIGWERNLQDHGVNRNFTLPFGWVKAAKKIIRDGLYNRSAEDKLFVLIQMLTLVFVPGVSYNWLYQYLYKGELDLSAAEDNADMINVPCMEGGIHKQLKANRTTKYTFPFDDEAVTVILDGIDLEEKAHYISAGPISNALAFNTHIIPVNFVNRDGISTGTGFFNQNLEDVTGPVTAYVASSSNYFLINNSGVSRTYAIKGKLRMLCTKNTANKAYRWWFSKYGDTTDIGSINVFNETLIPGVTYEVPIDIGFPLANGEKYFLFGRFFSGGGVEIAVDYLEGSFLDVSFTDDAAATKTLAYTKDVLFRKLVGKITGNEANAQSLLCEEKKYTVVTSAEAIRQLTDATITTSLEDFFDDMDCTYMAGLNVTQDGKLELESRLKYYDTSDPVDLGNLRDVEITPANEFKANKFKFGHQKPDIDDVNGKYDPNGSNEFTGPLLKSVNEYLRISPYKAGPYEIESIRRNLDGKVTTDDKRDKDVFVINCISHKVINAVVTFDPAGFFTIPNADYLAAGQQIQIAGSVFNDGQYNVTNVGLTSGDPQIYVNNSLTVEAGVAVTITVLRGEILTLNRPAYSLLEGVPNDTVFNLPDLTPKAMLLAHGRWIRSMHKGWENASLIFASGDKNTALKTTLNGATVDEDANELIIRLGDPVFLPFYASATVTLRPDIAEILEANPNRCFTGYDELRGVQIEGFLMATGFAPNDLREQEIRLLLTPNNDLSLFV